MRQFQDMSKSDYSNPNDQLSEIPLWHFHETLKFNSGESMLEWASDDKLNFSLSDKVYLAMVDCLENNIESMIVASILVKGQTQIDVLIRRDNFQKILSGYTKRLLESERYEKLDEIKKFVQKFSLEVF
jgi:hypothetical protein